MKKITDYSKIFGVDMVENKQELTKQDEDKNLQPVINSESKDMNNSQTLDISNIPSEEKYVHPEFEIIDPIVNVTKNLVKPSRKEKLKMEKTKQQLKMDKDLVNDLIQNTPELGSVLLKNKGTKFMVKYKDPVKRKYYRIYISLQDFNN